jgi:hypothetical protein
MSVITSIYLPYIQKNINAEFIAHIFERNDIAQVSRIAIEFNKKTKKSCAYIAIDSWRDTENAYNFIARLKNPNKEARIVYKDDDWWVAEINYLPHKLYSSNKKRVVTIFANKKEDNFCDFDLTQQLKTALFGQPVEPRFAPDFDDLDLQDASFDLITQATFGSDLQDALDFDQYLRDIDIEREFALGRQDILYEMNCM